MENKQQAKFNQPITIDKSMEGILRIFPKNLKEHMEDERKVARELIVGDNQNNFFSMEQEIINLK